MNASVAKKLIALNHQFYQTFATPFSATRQRIQPGVQHILMKLHPGGRILDLGCGNGEVAHHLQRQGWQGQYVGIDFCPELLEDANESTGTFVQADLSMEGWSSQVKNHLTQLQGSEESRTAPSGHAQDRIGLQTIFAFAVLHHIPGNAMRLQLLQQVRELLAPDGQFILSNWQFLNSSRLAQRVQPWETIGLSKTDLDTGDYLLDWRSGGTGLRYVHHFSEEELASLAQSTGFQVSNTFYSDGKTRNLGLYQTWRVLHQS